ncbi:MAG: hypothetical protein AAF515_20350 [Pseudomonadota bacterium]
MSHAAGADPNAPSFNKKLKSGGQLEYETTFSVPPRTRPTNSCAADIEIDYEQRGDQFHVLARVSGTECPDAYGTYTVRARATDSAEQITTQRFEERWQISDDSAFVSRQSYPLNDANHLLWVRVAPGDCTCETGE